MRWYDCHMIRGKRSHVLKMAPITVRSLVVSFLVCSVFSAVSCLEEETNYIVGVGISDITGPAAQVDMVNF